MKKNENDKKKQEYQKNDEHFVIFFDEKNQNLHSTFTILQIRMFSYYLCIRIRLKLLGMGWCRSARRLKKYQDISRAYRELIPVSKYFVNIIERFIIGFSDPCFDRISDPSRDMFGRAFSRPAPKLRRSLS